MNKTFREDPREHAKAEMRPRGPSSSDEEPKSKKSWLLAGGDSRRIANSDPYPCRHSFFLDQLSTVFCIPLLTCTSLSRNRLTQHKASNLLFIPPNYTLESPCPPRRQRASRTVRATSRGSIKLQSCALHSQTHEGGLRTQYCGVVTALA